VSEDVSDKGETGHTPGPTGVEHSTAEASVVAHGTIPFGSGPEPRGGRGRRVVLVVGVVLAVALALAVVVALLVS
jgi:hypothetical protein